MFHADLDKDVRIIRDFLCEELGSEEGIRIWLLVQEIQDLPTRIKIYADIVKDLIAVGEGKKPVAVERSALYKWEPVTIKEFVTGEYYLNKKDEVYDKVLEELVEINTPGKYVEIVLTGGIGSAKTTTALYTQAYQLYLLSCMHSPHRVFGLDKASEILIVFQSINATISAASFKRFKAMVEDCHYFKDHFPHDKDIEKRLIFPHRIEVVPVSGMETAVIGQNVIGGMIDELNYMQMVKKSKQSVDQGTYNQAVALYNSIARRRKSRFVSGAEHMPGLLCLVSSKRYPGQFTDLKEEEAKREVTKNGHSTIYIYDYRVWDVKPKGTFTKGWFKVFVGDLTRKPRILAAGEVVDKEDEKLTMPIPVDFLEDFNSDIINALREIAGVSTLSRHPFFLNTEAVAASFGHHPSIFSQESVDFVTTQLALYPKRVYKPELPRFVHVDLAVSGDSAGLVMGTVTGFSSMKELGFGNDNGMMPRFHIDGLLEIKPPKNGEILFWKIREVIAKMRALGINVRWVTFDQFQSKDSQQLLRQAGFTTGVQSMDIVPCEPYDFTKAAIYSGRVRMPTHERARLEILSLEKDTKTGKVDHPPTGSKDIVDALAGVVYGLTMRREIWGMYSIPLVRIPDAIKMVQDKVAQKEEAVA